MSKLEENLRKIKIKEISKQDSESLWHGIMVKRLDEERRPSRLSVFNVFNFNMKKSIVGLLVAVLLLGGTGIVSASNSAVPGDILFPIELVLEKLQVKFSSESQREELRLRFAEERVSEIKKVSEKKSTPAAPLVADLLAAVVLEIEADVFTNETVVKIKADNKNYGYISALKTKAELIKEISTKYSISEAKVSAAIDFETEDRTSQSDDKGFLNKTRSINFSENESEDVSLALSEIEAFLNEGNDNPNREELKKSLMAILVLLGDDGKLEIRRDDGRIKIETKDGEVKIKMKTEKDKSGKSDDEDNDQDLDDDKDELNQDKDDDKDDKDKSSDNSILINADLQEDDSEVFCRGEWRDGEDCEDNDRDSDDDNSGKEDTDDNSD